MNATKPETKWLRWGDWCSYDRIDVKQDSLGALTREIQSARQKFPGNRHALTALTEELGELARALLQRQGREKVCREALQVACVAMRIYEEGDATFADVNDEESQP